LYVADMEAVEVLWQMRAQRRQTNPELPDTVARLTTPEGSVVYLVGTAHFSDSSKKDVTTNGMMSGLMQILLLKVSAHITEQLGMAPGGEFREAFKEVGIGPCSHSYLSFTHTNLLNLSETADGVFFFYYLFLYIECCLILFICKVGTKKFPPLIQAGKVPFCKFHLGDRPIPVTFKRAIAALSLWQKARLAWGLCFLSDPISKEDVEKCKQKDLLEQTMSEMIGEFPALHRTIVAERDIYLTHTLRQAARCVESPPNGQKVPAVVVGVVGMGHVPGIEKNWDKELNIHEIMSVAPPSRFGWVLRTMFKGALFGVLGYACYRAGRCLGRAFLSLPAVRSLENIRP
ncbi:traB domain-containing protein, partial [Silurus asotus]